MHLPRDHTSQYTALVPAQPLDQVNPPRTRAALEAARFDLSRADTREDEAFSRVIAPPPDDPQRH